MIILHRITLIGFLVVSILSLYFLASITIVVAEIERGKEITINKSIYVCKKTKEIKVVKVDAL